MKLFFKKTAVYDQIQSGYVPSLHLRNLTQRLFLRKAKEINLCERKWVFHGQNHMFHGQKWYFREQNHMFHGQNPLFHGKHINTFSSPIFQFNHKQAGLYV